MRVDRLLSRGNDKHPVYRGVKGGAYLKGANSSIYGPIVNNLNYPLKLNQNFFIAAGLRKLIGLIPVGDLDFFF